jgi:hypothetical protein
MTMQQIINIEVRVIKFGLREDVVIITDRGKGS